MKWKCNACVCGPCVYESARDDDYLMRTDKCPRGALITRWQKMSGEEQEQKGKIGLPEWLKVGSFVKFGACNPVCRIEGYDTEQKILSISRKVWGADRIVKNDVRCEAGWGEAQVVFPQPYTFETAPVALKVRRKDDGQIEVARLFAKWFRKLDSETLQQIAFFISMDITRKQPASDKKSQDRKQ